MGAADGNSNGKTAGLANAFRNGMKPEPKRRMPTGRVRIDEIDMGREYHCRARAAERNSSRTDHLPVPADPQRPHK